jgi:hypothetical protein
MKPLHILQPIFDWVVEGMANVNELLDWLLKPVVLILKVLFRAIRFVLHPIINFFFGQSAMGAQ